MTLEGAMLTHAGLVGHCSVWSLEGHYLKERSFILIWSLLELLLEKKKKKNLPTFEVMELKLEAPRLCECGGF